MSLGRQIWPSPSGRRRGKSQLEGYIAEKLGDDYLLFWQDKTELREIKREMAQLRKRLDELVARRAEIEGPP